MNTTQCFNSKGRLFVSAIGILIASTAVAQQQPQQQPQQQKQVTVEAQRGAVIMRGRVGSSMKNMGELITLTRRVDFSDLDLSTSTGTDMLRKRVDDLARDTCHELEMLYPDGASDVPGYERVNENCVNDAVAGASATIDAAVLMARK